MAWFQAFPLRWLTSDAFSYSNKLSPQPSRTVGYMDINELRWTILFFWSNQQIGFSAEKNAPKEIPFCHHNMVCHLPLHICKSYCKKKQFIRLLNAIELIYFFKFSKKKVLSISSLLQIYFIWLSCLLHAALTMKTQKLKRLYLLLLSFRIQRKWQGFFFFAQNSGAIERMRAGVLGG